MSRRTIHDLVAEAKAEIRELSVDDLRRARADDSVVVVDIRDFREQIDKGAIPGAVAAPRGMLEFWFDPESPYHRESFTFDNTYVFYCASGWRSALAAKVIGELGFDVAHLEPGFTGWADAGEEIEDVAANARWVRRER